MSNLNIVIGADPEVFVKKDGVFVTGHGLIEGSKENPFKVDKGAVQVDGMALEFNIDPASTADEFLHNITTVRKQLEDMVPGHEVVAQPTADFGKEYMATMPEEALELGCEPDFDAWNEGAANKKPDGEVSYRTGGGHVHIGWTEGMDIEDPDHKEAAMMVVRQMDFYLGLASLFWDSDTKRRKMYGKAGAYRVKPYGVEYRSLSNAWLSHPNIIRTVFNLAKLAVEDLLEGNDRSEKHSNHLAKSINSSEKDLARAIINSTLGRGARLAHELVNEKGELFNV